MRKPNAYRFGDFRLTIRPLSLQRQGRDVPLQLQPLKLLALLVEKGGGLASHDEIRAHLWNGRTVEFQRGVHVSVKRIRAALGDEADRPTFIQNVPGQGYRFLAPVTPEYEAAPPWAGRGAKIASMGATAALLLLLALAGAYYWERGGSPADRSAVADISPATDAYERGLYLLNRPDRQAVRRSIALFDQSLATDPGFAPAHAAAAGAHARLYEFDKARVRADRALALDAGNAAAHLALGRVALMHDWDWDAARRHFEAARERDGDNAELYEGLANYFMLKGDFDRGLEAMERARALDPASALIRADYGWFHYFAGNYESAIRICREADQLAPEFLSHRRCIIYAMAAKGDPEGAAREIGLLLEARGLDDGEISAMQQDVRANGLSAFFRWRYDTLTHPEKKDRASESSLASLCAYMGDADCAIGHLERAVAERDHLAPYAAINPAFDDLRSDPRLIAILDRLGLRQGTGT